MTLVYWCWKCEELLHKYQFERDHKGHNDDHNKRVKKTIELYNEREKSFQL